MTARAAILVEGASDACALEALARRLGRDLAAEGVVVVPMGGATNIRHYVERLGPGGRGLRLTGLCDAAERWHFLRALRTCGFGPDPAAADLESLGFFTCVEDLEDELVRALGAAEVQRVIAGQGELTSLRVLQRQPAQRTRTVDQQLRRFFGSQSGRKQRYAGLLVDALEPDRVPHPLRAVLAAV